VHKAKLLDSLTTHGKSNERIYRIWRAMRDRAKREIGEAYKNYGGRGITVCDEWNEVDGFSRFYEWAMENMYTDSLTIDRIDNSKGYCPENCRWVDTKAQANNTRRNLNIEFRGETKTLKQWTEFLGIKYPRTYCRLYKLKWSIEDAFSE